MPTATPSCPPNSQPAEDARAAADAWLRANRGLIVGVARRFKLIEDDAIAELSVAAWRAFIAYRDGRGSKLSTFVAHCLNNAAMKIHRQRRRRSWRFTNGMAQLPEGAAEMFAAPAPIVEPDIEGDAAKALASLSAAEKAALLARPKTRAQITKSYRVRRRIRRQLAALRR